MADRIKGITIEIDGNTKGLSQALKGVNKDIKTTQTQLKDVEKLLKLDPRNVTLLGQKMELLGREISQTKDKLAQLKSVSDQMEAGVKNGTVSADQYDAWQREIIETENELKNLQAELKNVPTASEAMIAKVSDHMDSVGQRVSSVGDKIAGLGDALMPVTAGITALGTASIAAWKDVDEALDSVIARTGATGTSLEELKGIVEDIATTVPTDFNTVANSVAEVNTRFDISGQELEDLSTAFIKFASLNNTDVISSIDNVSAMMAAWSIDTKDAAAVLDVLNGVGQQTGASVDELASILQSNALSFKEMGYDVSEAAVLLGQMEKYGVDASAGVTALRKAMVKAVSDGTDLNTVMTEWEALMGSSASEAEKLAATEELFGSKAFAQLYNAIKEGNISFTEINASMSDFSGNLERTFEATLDPADEFTTTMNELKLLGAEIGEEVLPVLVDVLKDLKPILDDVREAWEAMTPEEQRALIENLGKLAALAPALSFSGRAISGIGHGLSGIAKIGKGLSGLGIGSKIASLFSGGEGIAAGVGTAAGASIGTAILAGIGTALGGGAIATLLDKYVIAPILEYFGSDSASWYKNFKWFGDGGFFDEMFNFSSFQEYWEVGIGAQKLMFEDLKALVMSYLDLYKQSVTETLNFISNAWEISVNSIKNVASYLADSLPKVWETIKNGVQTAWDTVANTFTDFKDGVFQTFQDIFDKIKEIWDSLGAMFEAGFDIKLPHISVSGGVAPYGIGGQGSLPKFDIDWYANGGILTSPTIFGMQNGRLLGGGEAGAEAVLPLSNLQTMIVDGMTQALGNGGDTVINVSIDNNNLGSVLLTAQQMMSLRRGK
jgi:phage-related minor tail protein